MYNTLVSTKGKEKIVDPSKTEPAKAGDNTNTVFTMDFDGDTFLNNLRQKDVKPSSSEAKLLKNIAKEIKARTTEIDFGNKISIEGLPFSRKDAASSIKEFLEEADFSIKMRGVDFAAQNYQEIFKTPGLLVKEMTSILEYDRLVNLPKSRVPQL